MALGQKTGTPGGVQGLTYIGNTFKSVVLMNYNATGWDNTMPTPSLAIADSNHDPRATLGPNAGIKV